MAKNFRELEAKMKPERLAQAKARAKVMMAEMLLAEIRRSTGQTQEEVAAILGVKQSTLSRLESQEDMQISTLNRLIQCLAVSWRLLLTYPKG